METRHAQRVFGGSSLTFLNSVLIPIFFLITSTHGLIASPPSIINQPSSTELLFQFDLTGNWNNNNSHNFLLECEAEGEPSPKYNWTKNGKAFDWRFYGDRISQKEGGGGTLIFKSNQPEDAGQYQCFAYNKYGTATSTSVFLRQAFLNSFKEDDIQITSAEEGKPFHLTCVPPDGYPKPRVYWMHQFLNSEGKLKSINPGRITVDPEGILWFSNVTKEDHSSEFIFVCVAYSEFTKEYKTGSRTYLTVTPIANGSDVVHHQHEPQLQYTSERNITSIRGSTLKLWCIFGGTPLPKITWRRKGVDIVSSGRLKYEKNGKVLKIKKINYTDQGEYSCKGSNGIGQPISFSMNVAVVSSPYFTTEPKSIQNVYENGSATFLCEAGGDPTPAIQWTHNGNPLKDDNPRRKVEGNKIIVENFTITDMGNYGCNASNLHGYVYKDVYLNVLSITKNHSSTDSIGRDPRKMFEETEGSHPSVNSAHEIGEEDVVQDASGFSSWTLFCMYGLPAVVLLLLMGSVIAVFLRKKQRREARLLLTNNEVKLFSEGNDNASEDYGKGEYLSRPFKSKFEIQKEEFTSVDRRVLRSQGVNVTVYQGIVKGTPVAVREFRNCSKGVFLGLLKDVKLLSNLGSHRNLVEFVGCYTKEIQNGVLFTVTKFCDRGSLSNYLNSLENPGTAGVAELMRFSLEIASGMEFVSRRKIVHGNLSARNVLLDENLTCKIGNFSLWRRLSDPNNPLPWQWMAYESLVKIEFSKKSDVWNYGVTLWEIFSLGELPYSSLKWTSNFPEDLRNGFRLSSPRFASEEVFGKMLSCWNLETKSRPSFRGLSEFFLHRQVN